MISDESLDILKETAPELWRELTRKPATLPQQPRPRVTNVIHAYRIVVAMFPELATPENGDIVEGEWRHVR